jgi:hypothetical protein
MPVKNRAKVPPITGRTRSNVLIVDLASILSIDHTCDGCRPGERCCCSAYEVCVTTSELERIIAVLPEAARFCPDLHTGDGYDNIFDEVETGLFAIETNDDGLCLFAFRSGQKVRCSLHAAGAALGFPPEKVKPKACLLWPMNFSEGREVLSLVDDALTFRCNTPRRGRSRKFSPSFVKTVEGVYGKGVRERLELEAAKDALRTKVSRGR